MTPQGSVPLSLSEIAHCIDVLRQLKQHIETVRQDFMVDEGARPHVPPEVSTFHLRREMWNVERQIRQALIFGFGEESAEIHQFREAGFAHATSESLKQGLLIVDRSIIELEQKRLQRSGPTRVSRPGIDSTTDLYTECILTRYVEHEIAWSQRQGEPFGLLLFRLPDGSWPASFARELVISAACVLKTRLRGYDIPCRVSESEFAVLLRQANALDVYQVALRITTDLQAAARARRPLTEVPIEFTSAVYPYDAESLEGLFAHASQHWGVESTPSSDTVEAPTSVL